MNLNISRTVRSLNLTRLFVGAGHQCLHFVHISRLLMDTVAASDVAIPAWTDSWASCGHTTAAPFPIQISSICPLHLLGWYHRNQHLLPYSTPAVSGRLQALALVSLCFYVLAIGHCSTLALCHSGASGDVIYRDAVMVIRLLTPLCGMQCVLDKLHPNEAHTVPLHAGEVLGGVGGLSHV